MLRLLQAYRTIQSNEVDMVLVEALIQIYSFQTHHMAFLETSQIVTNIVLFKKLYYEVIDVDLVEQEWHSNCIVNSLGLKKRSIS